MNPFSFGQKDLTFWGTDPPRNDRLKKRRNHWTPQILECLFSDELSLVHREDRLQVINLLMNVRPTHPGQAQASHGQVVWH